MLIVAGYGLVFTVDRLVWFNWLTGGVGFVYVLVLGLCLFGMICGLCCLACLFCGTGMFLGYVV